MISNDQAGIWVSRYFTPNSLHPTTICLINTIRPTDNTRESAWIILFININLSFAPNICFLADLPLLLAVWGFWHVIWTVNVAELWKITSSFQAGWRSNPREWYLAITVFVPTFLSRYHQFHNVYCLLEEMTLISCQTTNYEKMPSAISSYNFFACQTFLEDSWQVAVQSQYVSVRRIATLGKTNMW